MMAVASWQAVLGVEEYRVTEPTGLLRVARSGDAIKVPFKKLKQLRWDFNL